MATVTHAARVHAVTWAGADSLLFELRPATPGAELPAPSPGDHVDVHAGGFVRQYSLVSASSTARYLLCVRREPAGRGGSAAVHEALRPGRTVTISAPRSAFALKPAARTLLLGAGIGVTPLLAMAEHLHGEGADFALWFFASSRERAPLLEYLAAQPWAASAHVRFSADGESPRRAVPALLAAPTHDAAVYACGPAGFMAHVRASALAAGWTPDQLHEERFAPSAPVGVPDGPDGAGADTAFTVRLARRGSTFEVPVGQSVAEVLSDAGVPVELSCEQGMCGACVVRVLQGEIDHRDEVLSDAERAAGDQMTICCSRSRTAELLLDL